MKKSTIVPCEPGWLVSILLPNSEKVKQKLGIDDDYSTGVYPIIAWHIQEELDEDEDGDVISITSYPLVSESFANQEIICGKAKYAVFSPESYIDKAGKIAAFVSVEDLKTK